MALLRSGGIIMIYDVYFKPQAPMVIAVEASSPEEAKKLIENDNGDILGRNELVNRFLSSLEFDYGFEVTDVVEID